MMSPIHVIFCGTPEFALPALRALANDKRFSVDLVITQPDRPVGRKGIITSPPVKREAEKHGIPVFQPESLNREWKAYAREHNVTQPDFLVVVAYGQILSQEILMIPRIAPVNVHASLLPQYRGASPIHHALLHGDRTTGVTIQRMAEKLDAGHILSQATVEIDDHTTLPALYDMLSREGARLLTETLTQPLQETPQDESQATFCGKLTRKDGDVDPATMTARDIDRRVRALVPWPGVRWNDLKILETSLEEAAQAAPIICKDASTLHLVTVQPAGGRPMSGADWARGRKPDHLS